MNYLHRLVNSKQEISKRKMIQLIDDIHEFEHEQLEEDLNYIKPEMREWEKKHIEPVNFEVTVFDK